MNRNEGQRDSLNSDQAFERRLREGLEAISVPADMEARLLQRVLQQPSEFDAAGSTGSVVAGESMGTGVSIASTESNGGDREGGDLGRDATPRRKTWYWLSRGLVALAASLALLAAGLVWLSGSPDSRQLAENCLLQLNRLEDLQWEPVSSLPTELELFIQHQLSLSRPNIIGKTECPAGVFGTTAGIWKIADRRGELYIFLFDGPPAINGLSSQLRVIQDSGPWNLAAKVTSKHVFVLAATGDVRQFFKSPSFA